MDNKRIKINRFNCHFNLLSFKKSNNFLHAHVLTIGTGFKWIAARRSDDVEICQM